MPTPAWVGPAISAAGSVIGGAIGTFGSSGSKYSRTATEHQTQLSRETTRRYIWDLTRGAIRAGIHPLAALGVSPNSSNSPVVLGGQNFNPLGDSLAKAGQNIGKALDQANNEMAKLQIENQKTQNKILDVELQERQNALDRDPPDFPNGDIGMEGQGSNHRSNEHNMDLHGKDRIGIEPRVSPASRWSRSGANYIEFPSTKNQEAIESSWINQIEDLMRRGEGAIHRTFSPSARRMKFNDLPPSKKGEAYWYVPLEGFVAVPKFYNHKHMPFGSTRYGEKKW